MQLVHLAATSMPLQLLELGSSVWTESIAKHVQSIIIDHESDYIRSKKVSSRTSPYQMTTEQSFHR